jgi:hypothetical protein
VGNLYALLPETPDISSVHLKEAYRKAKVGGYTLLCPDIKPGVSMEHVIDRLYMMAQSDANLSNYTVVIDTLKKLTNVINKAQVREMYQMLRALTGRGATVICLAHTNKYKQEENGMQWPMYEGTGDLRSDFDALVLLYAYSGDYGEITTSLYWREQGCDWAKVRGIVEPLSWTIDKHDNRKVTDLDEWVDTMALKKATIEVKQVSDVITDIHTRHFAPKCQA